MGKDVNLGPRNEEERLIFAIEEMRLSVQCAIQEAMTDKSVSRSELARRLKLSAPRVTQMFSEEANPQLETIARIAFCLDVNFSFTRSEQAKWACADATERKPVCWENKQIPELENEVGERAKKPKKDDAHFIQQIQSRIMRASVEKCSDHSNGNECHISFVRAAA